MAIPSKITLIFLPPLILLKQDGKKVGQLQKIPKGFELKYLDQVLNIKEKSIDTRKIIEIDNEKFLFSSEKIFSLPQKKVEIIITKINGKITFKNPQKEKVMKVISLGDIQYLEFLIESPNFLFNLFVALFYLT